jgi:diguanylate cyclase (GGDEF)-like protein
MKSQLKTKNHSRISGVDFNRRVGLPVKIRAKIGLDCLTGLANHRFMQERLNMEIQHAQRTDNSLSVMIVDIYNFRLFNETYGYKKGDELLKLVARLLSSSVRRVDIVGRYGGDEFILILPGTVSDGAVVMAKRILTSAAQCKFPVSTTKVIPIDLNIGIAVFPDDSSTRQEIVSMTEEAVAEARQQGANTIRVAKPGICRGYAHQDRAFSVLDSLVVAVDTKDHYTKLHSENVAYWALELAQRLKLSKAVKKSLYFGGLLHDIGKIGIPESILRKPGALTEEEIKIIQQHPVLGKMIIQEVPQFKDMLDMVLHHHEWFDGKGYPDGLKGEQIPFLARLLGVVDAFSAMTIDRPYHKALSVEKAISKLEQGSGIQFDPQIVKPFIKVVRDVAVKGKALTCWEYKKCKKYNCPLYNNKLGHLCCVIREILYDGDDKSFANDQTCCETCSFSNRLEKEASPLNLV